MPPVSRLDLSKFRRFALLEGPTPIQHLSRLSRYLGGAEIFVKREDLNGLGGGGNKLRKLEFLIGEALTGGADTIITVGARQSNHARLTAAAAVRAGLKCELVLTRLVPRYDEDYIENGNILLDSLLGAHVHDLPASANALAFAEDRANTLRAEGRSVYVCPLGGSSPVGCLGYADCAVEIAEQSDASGLLFDHIVVPNGSGGMHAGLIAGVVALGKSPSSIVGHTVYSQPDQARSATLDKANQTVRLIDPELTVSDDAVAIEGGQLGDGYGIPTDGMRNAVRLLASTEGLFVDPVYGGKAFAGLLHDVETGKYHAGQRVLFVMTGGLPGLFAYRSAF
ncbi:D-cysteine desulfhydrase family protein [Paraburkholderia fungorum]|jgi:L-cysteate sulfo-lyase|uniref:D-cysteine desulfhydrase n=2 Tax=Paraburkholderia fungorum TaxID=134537 RepID=A0AAW3V396_9BURK|nr:D-cysteine desulfhydrase family protein [Paraburkholderia fungorum]AJZ56377.1 pyridoxal-phosphate dependent enzyme family protein [Paraburkholderia fungorum]MBB4516553.1 D-cysteine desulfhydrase [Paraburkholderia fungorum]MBB5545189.1 D-cysteine desulfhydrase [Paraburkholderia fungorum]MBB6204974.1 D-cysteine desulfhydrase [Paraburkholderia fungorum]MBU7440590.1 D-cysteine desulfhydrase family protein [Paraburkholderia fungorum]